MIASLSFSRTRFYVKIDDEELFKFGAYVIPFVVTIGISFLALVLFMVSRRMPTFATRMFHIFPQLIKCCLHRRHARRHRLPRSALKQLKTKKFVKGDRWDVCAICLDDYEEGAKLRILPCDHGEFRSFIHSISSSSGIVDFFSVSHEVHRSMVVEQSTAIDRKSVV